MLILTIRPGEPLHIGDAIVHVLDLNGRAAGRCKVGVEAPKDTPVDRDSVRRSKNKRK